MRTVFDIPEHVHFLTFSTYQLKPIFYEQQFCRLFADCLSFAKSKERFRLYAWVLMPEHVHLLLQPTIIPFKMATILRRIKETFSRDAARWLQEYDPDRLNEFRVRHGRRKVHAFWQRGGGYDRNLFSVKLIRRAIQYIEQNPVRRHLITTPEDWQWSGSHFRAHDHESSLCPDLFEGI